MGVHTVSFMVDLGQELVGDLPEEMQLHRNKIQLSFGVGEKDIAVFTKVLRDNGVPHSIHPDGAVEMTPESTEIYYTESDGDEDDDEDDED